jgi:hypothetical protein
VPVGDLQMLRRDQKLKAGIKVDFFADCEDNQVRKTHTEGR